MAETTEKIFFKVLLSTEEILTLRNALSSDIKTMTQNRSERGDEAGREFWQVRIDARVAAMEVFDDSTRRELVL